MWLVWRGVGSPPKWVHRMFSLLQFLPLTFCLILLIVHSIMYFLCDRKYQRTRHAGASSAHSSCSWIALVGNITHPSFARRLSLSAGSRVLRNLICAAIQINIYPHKSSNSLAQWPATGGASIVLFNGAGFLLKLPLQCKGIPVFIIFGYSSLNVRM